MATVVNGHYDGVCEDRNCDGERLGNDANEDDDGNEWVHAHRTAGGHCHHRAAGVAAPAGAAAGPREHLQGRLRQQPAADRSGAFRLRRRRRRQPHRPQGLHILYGYLYKQLHRNGNGVLWYFGFGNDCTKKPSTTLF